MKSLVFILFLLIPLSGMPQDSTTVLTYETYIQTVMNNHPYAFQANIKQSMGEAGVTQSRGAFDPTLFGNIDQKYFEDKQYYSQLKAGLKIPTWFGISAESGYVLNEGVFLNPERQVPNSGLWYAGLRLELGNGLIIDQRRAEFEKAKLYQSATELERTVLLNQLQLEASVAYYQWQQAYQKAKIYQLAFENADIRLTAVKDAAYFGDRPYIDTVEASLSVYNRYLSLLRAETSLKNAEFRLEMYLWSDGFIPLEVENMIPEETSIVSDVSVPVHLDTALLNHPIVQINDLELQQRRVDIQLKKEQLKPRLTLEYNALNEPINGNPVIGYSPANYTWGATFAYPILTRKERGGVQLARLKLQDQELKNKMNIAELKYNIRSTFTNYIMVAEQIRTTTQLVNSNELMYTAEKELFNLGESSVFMINSRENQWLKSRIQLIETEFEYRALQADLKYHLMLFDLN